MKNNYISAISRSIKAFSELLENVNKDQDILPVVKGCKIPLSTKPHQKKIPGKIHMSLVQENLVYMEILEMPTKEAISVVKKNQKKGFLRNLFLVGKQSSRGVL